MYKAHKNFHRKPRIQYRDLEEHHEGLICLSACIGGELAKAIIDKDMNRTISIATYFRSIFKDDYYVEVQPNSIPIQKKVNEEISGLCSLGFQPIVTCDAHYVTKEDYYSHDTMLCIQVQKKKDDKARFRFTCNDFYLKENSTVKRELDYLNSNFVDLCIKNTYSVADKCNLVMDTKKNLLPKMPGIDNEALELAKHCNIGFQKRKEQGHYIGMDLKEVTDRITYELKNIIEKGFAGYFLIVEDFMNFCEEKDIPTGVGRGSVCGSEVAFVLGITEVEPIKYGLLYERFLNPTRTGMVDIDSDVCYERRMELIEYIKQKYGEENVSHIITEGKMTTKAVIRKVLTAYDYDMKAINATCKLVDDRCKTLEEAMNNSEELRRRLSGRLEYGDMLLLEGLMSHAGKHAAGLLITPEPVYTLFPTRIDREDNVLVCEWHKKHIEAMNGWKFDLLGLKQLTIFDKTIKAINRSYNKNLKLKDLYNINYEDPEIYRILNEGNLRSIFQFTGGSASAIINQMKPKCFNDIMVAESICRPGVEEAQLYLSNKKLFDETGTYPTPSYHKYISNIVNETYGAIVYQEQTMRILNQIGGFTLGEADGLRKVKSLEPYREQFINNALNVGLTLKEATELFNRFSLEYSFNKSHACAYGKISALCCWFLAYYPKEFLSSSMTLELTQADIDIAGFIKEATKIGIKILPPDINISTNEFYASEEGIMFPLTVISFIGSSAYSSIISKRPFSSFSDFLTKVPKKNVKKNAVVNLIKAGCFDLFNQNRSFLLTDFYNSRNEEVDVYYWCDDVQIIYETEVFGFSLGKHPLDGQINNDIKDYKEDEVINIVGVVTAVRTHIDKNKKNMAFLKLDNKKCDFEGIVFSYGYERLSSLLHVGAKLGLQGKKQGNTILINNAWRL